jgi:hypothetical protein
VDNEIGDAQTVVAKTTAELWLVWRRLAITNGKHEKVGISPRLSRLEQQVR